MRKLTTLLVSMSLIGILATCSLADKVMTTTIEKYVFNRVCFSLDESDKIQIVETDISQIQDDGEEYAVIGKDITSYFSTPTLESLAITFHKILNDVREDDNISTDGA